jgi:hypothetical protein
VSRPLVAAILVTLLSLTAAVAATSEPTSAASAGSVTARAAQADAATGGDQRYPIGSAAMEAAKAVAIAHWGAQPCGGQVLVSWTTTDATTNATAAWRNPSDPWSNPGANFDCRIDLNTQAGFDFAKLCSVLAHEMGHLLGRAHDGDSGTLMSAYYSSPLASCQSASPESAPADAGFDDGWTAMADAPATKRRTLRKTATRKVRRCVVRKRAGKRVKRCFTVRAKAPTALRASR